MSLLVEVLFAISPTLLVWYWMYRRQKRLRKQLADAIEQCECQEAFKRAQEGHDTVTRMMEQLDSRHDDAPVTIATSEPATKEHVPLCRQGSALLSVPILALLLAAAFIACHYSADKPQTVKAESVAVPDETTLADVTRLSLQKPTPEVVAMMRQAARSSNRDVKQSAEATLARWGM